VSRAPPSAPGDFDARFAGIAVDMDVDELRLRNEAKADEERERGPTSSDPESAPVGDAIEDFHDRDALAFGIPAHRFGTGSVEFDAAVGPAPRPSAPTSG
jgi:hypothetical protein